jgi:hypothetical protein
MSQSNELLELSHEQWLDTGTAGAAGGAHPRLETVGAQRLDATSLRRYSA